MEDIENIATLNPNGKIKLTISGLYQFSLLLTIDAYVDRTRCLKGRNSARIQIDCFKNDMSLFYLTSVVHKYELRSIASPVFPIRMKKGDEIYIRVNKPLCIYPQGQTGVLTMTWMSCWWRVDIDVILVTILHILYEANHYTSLRPDTISADSQTNHRILQAEIPYQLKAGHIYFSLQADSVTAYSRTHHTAAKLIIYEVEVSSEHLYNIDITLRTMLNHQENPRD